MNIDFDVIDNDVIIPADIENTDIALTMEIESDSKFLNLTAMENEGEIESSLNELTENIDLDHENIVVIEAEAGGYYTPAVTQPDKNTMRVSFSPSKGTMLPITEVDITLPTSEGSKYEAGNNISIENNIISVLTADSAEQDNTKPITSAAVHTQIGNIQVLLETI